MESALEYTAKKGIELESSYRYTGRDGKCKYSKSLEVFENKSYNGVVKKHQSALQEALVKGPVSVSVDAAGNGW